MPGLFQGAAAETAAELLRVSWAEAERRRIAFARQPGFRAAGADFASTAGSLVRVQQSELGSSVSKVLSPRLRVAFIVGPQRELAALTRRVWATQWMVSALGPEIVSMWLEDGVVEAKQMIVVTPSSAFWSRATPPPRAVRISLGGVDSARALTRGLTTLAALARTNTRRGPLTRRGRRSSVGIACRRGVRT